MSIAQHHEITKPTADEPGTPAQILFELVRAAGYAPTRQAFADLVKVDRGNIYNYLAANGSPWRVVATTETIRQWGHAVERGTSARLRVAISEGVRGEVVIAVQGADAARAAFSSGPVRSALPLANHAWGTRSGRIACDALAAALRVYRPQTVCEHGERRCTIREGRRDLLRIQHREDEDEVRVQPKLPDDERTTLLAGLDAGAEAVGVADTGSAGKFVRVGVGHIEPARLAREVAVVLGWWTTRPPSEEPLAEELEGPFWEGGSVRVPVNRYERDPNARDACIAAHGTRCAACGLSYAERYGPLGAGFIHVHHREALHTADVPREVDPVRDLVPVCANCHSMLHRGTRAPRSIEELRALLARQERQGPPA